MDGTSSATQWSSLDIQRNGNGNGIHGGDIVEAREHESVRSTKSSKCVSEIVVESTRATGADKLEETDKSFIVESWVDGKQLVRKVGINLTATSLSTCSQLCRERNRRKIVQPYPDTLQVSRGRTKKGLADQLQVRTVPRLPSTLRGCLHCKPLNFVARWR